MGNEKSQEQRPNREPSPETPPPQNLSNDEDDDGESSDENNIADKINDPS